MNNNRWKRYFYYLLTVNGIFIIIIGSLLFWPTSTNLEDRNNNIKEKSGSEFLVRTTKTHLNELINAYIDQKLNGKDYHYQVALGEDVMVQGEVPMFSTTVPLTIHFDPYVLEDGNIVLKQKSISIGRLSLPNKQVMRYVYRLLSLPDWVQIYPEFEEIYIAITKMDFKSNFQLYVEQFDLPGNDLAFTIKVPYESLGLQELQAENK